MLYGEEIRYFKSMVFGNLKKLNKEYGISKISLEVQKLIYNKDWLNIRKWLFGGEQMNPSLWGSLACVDYGILERLRNKEC